MSDKTNYSQKANLERNLGISPSTTVYLGLNTVAGSDSAAGTECPDASYARQVIAWNASTTNATDVSTTNSGTVTFPAFAGAQTIVEWVVWDALTSGNRIYRPGTTPMTSQAIAAGNQISFPAGTITIKEK